MYVLNYWMQLLVNFVYTFINFVNVKTSKKEILPFSHVIVLPFLAEGILCRMYVADHFVQPLSVSLSGCLVTL